MCSQSLHYRFFVLALSGMEFIINSSPVKTSQNMRSDGLDRVRKQFRQYNASLGGFVTVADAWDSAG
jgi:hypothetical protein